MKGTLFQNMEDKSDVEAVEQALEIPGSTFPSAKKHLNILLQAKCIFCNMIGSEHILMRAPSAFRAPIHSQVSASPPQTTRLISLRELYV